MEKEALEGCRPYEHDFVFDENWRDEMEFGDNSLIIPETCRKCGKEGYENWVLDGVIERDFSEGVRYIYEA